MKILVLFACGLAAVCAQRNYATTPVPILKQINRHHDDGSYSYGYEGADGTFKIETKYPTGEVYGKYGYVGDDGKVREIEYGATKRGFEPVGTGINVPPPTLQNSSPDGNALDYDDGQYREDPSTYYKSSSASRRPFSRQPAPAPAPAPVEPPRYYNPTPAPTTYYNPTPAPPTYYNPAPQQQTFRNYNPAPVNFQGHPATNVNLQTGSYSLSYSG